MFKKFDLTPFDQGKQGKTQEAGQKTSFQMTWTRFESKEVNFSLNQYLREMEEKILKQAKDKSYLIEKEAYAKGFSQGEKDGLELGQKRADMVVQQFKSVLLELEAKRAAFLKTYEKEMVQLVLAISKKIIHKELERTEGVVEATLREAFQFVKDRRKIVVHLNPVDYRYLFSHSKDTGNEADLESLKIVEDPSMTRGGCLLETPLGDVDATIEAQLDEIISSVWKHFDQSGFFPVKETS